MANIFINKRTGIWVTKQGSINTVLADGAATTLLMSMKDEDKIKVVKPDNGKYAVMAVKLTNSIYRLFAFDWKQAAKELDSENLYNYKKWEISQT